MRKRVAITIRGHKHECCPLETHQKDHSRSPGMSPNMSTLSSAPSRPEIVVDLTDPGGKILTRVRIFKRDPDRRRPNLS
jgi:hypothetical protein